MKYLSYHHHIVSSLPSQIEQRQSSSELNRAKAREEIREKQKKREEHAKKVKVTNKIL